AGVAVGDAVAAADRLVVLVARAGDGRASALLVARAAHRGDGEVAEEALVAALADDAAARVAGGRHVDAPAAALGRPELDLIGPAREVCGGARGAVVADVVDGRIGVVGARGGLLAVAVVGQRAEVVARPVAVPALRRADVLAVDVDAVHGPSLV